MVATRKDKLDLLTWSAVGVAVCLAALVVGLWLGPGKDNQVRSSGSRPEPRLVVDQEGSDWPTVGGGVHHAGLAEGRLAPILQLAWTHATGGPVTSSAAVVACRVFVGSSDGNLYALGLEDGRLLWSFAAEDSIEAPVTVVGGRVFFGSRDGCFYAVSTEGRLLWRYKTGGQIAGAAGWFYGRAGQLRVVVGSYDGSLHCLDAEKSDLIWSYKTDNYINGSPAIWEDVCVAGGCDSVVHVVSTADGKALKTVDSGSYIAASMAVKDGYAYVGNYAGTMLKIALDSGSIIWKYQLEDTPILTCAAIHDGRVVFGARDNKLHCISDQDGSPLWAFQALGDVDSSPVICDGKVLFGSQDGRLYMVGLSDGRLLWSYQVGRPISAGCAVSGGVVVVGSEDGNIYAFGQLLTDR